MTPQQIKLVQSSFNQVAPAADDVAAQFYQRLFELNPDLRPLFKGDMKAQGEKLMKMIGMAVNSLGRLEQIVPAIRNLGRRHVDYGVREEDYDTVGQALLWTLEQGLGDDFTPECREAWTLTYTTLAETMKEAARGD